MSDAGELAPILFDVKLDADEILRLDGSVRPEVQKTIDLVKYQRELIVRYPNVGERMVDLVARAVFEAKTKGQIEWRNTSISGCLICRRRAGYAKLQRSSQKGRKGAPDYDKPLYFSGIDMEATQVTIRGFASVGGCVECVNLALPMLRVELANVRAEIPKQITGHEPYFKRWPRMTCKQCGWVGRENEMRLKESLMGGKYRGACPKCPAENGIFQGTNLERVKEPPTFEVVEAIDQKDVTIEGTLSNEYAELIEGAQVRDERRTAAALRALGVAVPAEVPDFATVPARAIHIYKKDESDTRRFYFYGVPFEWSRLAAKRAADRDVRS